MRSYQVFAGLAPDHAQALLQGLAEKAPAMFAQSLAAASAAMKARPSSTPSTTMASQCRQTAFIHICTACLLGASAARSSIRTR
jgi:5-carboxymethyl-2-hydroxymuconate isomerase